MESDTPTRPTTDKTQHITLNIVIKGGVVKGVLAATDPNFPMTVRRITTSTDPILEEALDYLHEYRGMLRAQETMDNVSETLPGTNVP